MNKADDEPLFKLLSDPWIRAQLQPYRRYFGQIFAIMGATIAINFAIPLTNRALVNQGILNNDVWFVDLIMVLQVAMYLSLIGLNSTRAKISGHVSNRLVTRMASEHVMQMLHLPMRFFHSAKSGEFVERVRDLDRVQRFAAVEAVEALTASISIFSLSILLLLVDLSIFLLFQGSAICYLAWIYLIGRRRRPIDAAQFREGSRARSLEIGMVEAVQDIRIAGYEQASLAAWAEVQVVALHTRLKALAIEQLQASGGHFFTRAGMVLVTMVAAKRAMAGEITLGDFTITSVIIVQLYFHLNQILAFTNKLEEVRAAIHRTREIRALHDQTVAQQAIGRAPRAWFPIQLDRVTMAYPEAKRSSIVDVTLTIPGGAMTALIGPSGSGKTSILKLLLGLYEPSAGSISVAGERFAEIDGALWRDGIGAVMQEGALFATSIRDNIAAGRPIDDAWMTEVIAAACLGDVLRDCERGADTLVGPGGARLSAGQVQRILIARALYKRPRLLLLDEATSALDGTNEAAIIENIGALLPGLTSVVAAHRLNTIKRAEQIVTLDQGRIVDIGDSLPPGIGLLSLSKE
ncbi:MAG: ATP-binding cassette domain-containing protein [Sphingopyxis sp.]|uniref:peptidase domain-containing ABC transporter n=1 Tax=Sphingopyxis sp. TaxID=1908224 RepID=UPI003D81047C